MGNSKAADMATEAINVVPVIDLANFPAELEKLAAASSGLGCFRVINHGIPLRILANMKETTRSLFDIPVEAKLRNVTGNFVDGGYVPPNYVPNIPFYESFGIYNAASPADVHSFCSLLDASTLQREIIVDYLGKLHILIMDLASKVAESLGLIGICSFKDWFCHARLNSYKFKFEEDIGGIGVPTHTDSGFLTVLQEDECVGGLEIIDGNGNFISVDPLPGTLFVNIGDVGKVWSNGRLQNVKHRVICKKAMPRISIVLFLLAPEDDKVEPQAAFIDIDHPKLYESYIYNEYRMQRRITGLRAGEILPVLNADRSSSNDALNQIYKL